MLPLIVVLRKKLHEMVILTLRVVQNSVLVFNPFGERIPQTPPTPNNPVTERIEKPVQKIGLPLP